MNGLKDRISHLRSKIRTCHKDILYKKIFSSAGVKRRRTFSTRLKKYLFDSNLRELSNETARIRVENVIKENTGLVYQVRYLSGFGNI